MSRSPDSNSAGGCGILCGMKLNKNPRTWPALIAVLNPQIIEASAVDRLTFAVWLPNEATVQQLLRVTYWFTGHETHQEEGDGIMIHGFAKREHLVGMAADLAEAKGAIVDTRN